MAGVLGGTEFRSDSTQRGPYAAPPAIANGDHPPFYSPIANRHLPLDVATLFDESPDPPEGDAPGYALVTPAAVTATALRGRGIRL